MKWISYSKYTGDDFGLSAEDLLKALSDFFLQSGFQNQYMGFSEWNQHTLEDLKNAIQRALEQGEMFDPEQAAADSASAREHDAGADGPDAEPPGPEAGGRGLHQHRAAAGQRSRPSRSGQCRSKVECRDHRQIHRFSWIQDAEGSARVRWANRASARTIRAIWRRASKPAAPPSFTNSATRSIWISARRCFRPSSARASRFRFNSNIPICTCTSPNIKAPARPC